MNMQMLLNLIGDIGNVSPFIVMTWIVVKNLIENRKNNEVLST